MPRFSSLRRAIGGTKMHVATADYLAGYDRESAGLLIVRTGDRHSRHERIAVLSEIVPPVCGSGFQARHPHLT